jgi:protease IV
MLPNLETLMSDKIGITIDGVKTNKYSDIGSIMRPMTDDERNFLQEQVNDFYEVFVSRVDEGRENLTYDEIDKVGEGRVWTGVNALEIGLVDGIGGINDAVLKAVELAELEEYRIVEYPKEQEFMEKLIEDFTMTVKSSIFKAILGENYNALKQVEALQPKEGIQTRMYYDFVIN